MNFSDIKASFVIKDRIRLLQDKMYQKDFVEPDLCCFQNISSSKWQITVDYKMRYLYIAHSVDLYRKPLQKQNRLSIILFSACVGVNLWQKHTHTPTHTNMPHTASINTWKAAASSRSLCHLFGFRLKLWERPLRSTTVHDLYLKKDSLQPLWWTQQCVWCWSTLWEEREEQKRTPNWAAVNKPVIQTLLILHRTASERSWHRE